MGICTLFPMTFHCQTIHNASDLIDDLLSNYKTVLRPVINQADIVFVNFSMELMSILEFDEVKGNLHVNGILVLNWIDQRLTWDEADYNSLNVILIESNKVWTPMIVHINTIEKTEKIGSDDPWQLIRIDNVGTAYYFPGGLLSSSCIADVTYYPFDSNTCTIEFIAWGFTSTELQLIPTTDKVLTNYYSPNGVWDLKTTRVYSLYENVGLNAELTLERKSRFVVFNVILPIVFMTILNTLVFLIPIESGERISYNITMLLAVAVFLTLVGDNLPKTSSPMSIFSYYLVTILALSVLFVIANIFSLRCYFRKDEETIHRHWRKVIKFSKLDFSKCRSKVHAETSSEDAIQKEHAFDVENSDSMKNKQSNGIKKDSQSVISLGQIDNCDNTSWQDISKAIDRLSFAIGLFLTLISTLIFFIVIYTGSRS
ncbi:hypothetical protein ACF0H5_018966 [Mactra antiquata]